MIDEHGNRSSCFRNSIIMSKDSGKTWQDITGKYRKESCYSESTRTPTIQT